MRQRYQKSLPGRRAAAMMLLVGLARPAWAQAPGDLVPDKVEVLLTTREQGWKPSLSGSATASFNDTRSVVGSEDGGAYNLGLIVNGALELLRAQHAWSNVLKWQLTYARTVQLPLFIKSLDALDLSSTYRYRPDGLSWLGPYGAATLQTAVLPGALVRASATEVRRLELDGTPVSTASYGSGEAIPLTWSWSPATVKQSAGLSADLFHGAFLALEGRVGLGLWETFVQGGYRVDDDGATPELELRRMQDSFQAGGELGLLAKGRLSEVVTYDALAELMQPFYDNATSSLSGLEKLNLRVEAQLGVKLSEWAALNYSLKAQRYPLVVDAWQLTNALLLTLTASVI